MQQIGGVADITQPRHTPRERFEQRVTGRNGHDRQRKQKRKLDQRTFSAEQPPSRRTSYRQTQSHPTCGRPLQQPRYAHISNATAEKTEHAKADLVLGGKDASRHADQQKADQRWQG
ncbi:hypothetical protein D3C81_1458770 [compost metagenome]